MDAQSKEKVIATFHDDLKTVKALVYDRCGLELLEPRLESEGKGYGACTFRLNGIMAVHRVSKITPTKTGQFVTIWKRNENGITEPFHILDNIDIIIITVRDGEKLGQFIFPKTVLADQGIVAHGNGDGKRGIRVYPPWATVKNKQAEKTQAWQKKYFLAIKTDGRTNLALAKEMFAGTNGASR